MKITCEGFVKGTDKLQWKLYGNWTIEEFGVVEAVFDKHTQPDTTAYWRIWSYANGNFKVKRSDWKNDTINVKGIDELAEKLQAAMG